MSDDTTEEGLGRRDLLKRGAMVGGALIWTVPAVQSLAGPAFANSSPAPELCSFNVTVTVSTGATGCVRVGASTLECCRALTAATAEPDPATRFTALINALVSPACTGVGSITNC